MTDLDAIILLAATYIKSIALPPNNYYPSAVEYTTSTQAHSQVRLSGQIILHEADHRNSIDTRLHLSLPFPQ